MKMPGPMRRWEDHLPAVEKQRMRKGFVARRARQEDGIGVKSHPHPPSWLDLPHQHDHLASGRDLHSVEFAGKRRSHSMRAFPVLFEPVTVIYRPRMIG